MQIVAHRPTARKAPPSPTPTPPPAASHLAETGTDGGWQPVQPWPFFPHPLVRHPFAQTFLSSYGPRGEYLVNQHTQTLVVDGGPDQSGYDPGGRVRLITYYTPAQIQPRKGVALLLHGWEGCSHSHYNGNLGSALIAQGYDVFRLNMRDHGPNHSLNPGFFYAALLDEVVTASRWISQLAGSDPFYVIGASLGGNFALRMAHRHSQQPFHNLQRVVAINPVIDPGQSSGRLDDHKLFLAYFRRRWCRSLRLKQALFPELYDFSPIFQIPTVRGMTEWLVRQFQPAGFQNADEYFAAYAIRPEMAREISIPVTILSTADDPLIPVADFYHLPANPHLDVRILPHGGHVGYIDLWPLHHKLQEFVMRTLAQDPGFART